MSCVRDGNPGRPNSVVGCNLFLGMDGLVKVRSDQMLNVGSSLFSAVCIVCVGNFMMLSVCVLICGIISRSLILCRRETTFISGTIPLFREGTKKSGRVSWCV